MPQIRLETERLAIRPWQDADRAPFAALCADPQVMRHFPGVLDRAQSDALIDRAVERASVPVSDRARGGGLGVQPVVRRADDAFLGFVGLSRPTWPVPGAPDCVEIGWRLARFAWGQGYATEAAAAWCRFGFETLGLREIVSFTATGNARSRRVMERLGMRRDPRDDFNHPLPPPGDPLRAHVLYRLAPPRSAAIAAGMAAGSQSGSLHRPSRQR